MKKNIWRYAKIILTLAALYFVAPYIIKSVDYFATNDINYWWFTLSVAIFVLYKYLQTLMWQWITRHHNCALPYQEALSIWSYSLLGKYVPGKVFAYGTRVMAYHSKGHNKATVTVCFLLENTMTVLSGFIVGVFLLYQWLINNLQGYIPVVLFTLVLLIIIHPTIYNWLVKTFLKLLKKIDQGQIEIKSPNYLTLLMYIFVWLVHCLGIYCLLLSLNIPTIIDHALVIIGAYSLASVIGIVSLFAPSGLGVREGVIILISKQFITSHQGGLVALTARLWTTLGEAIFVALSLTLCRLLSNDRQNTGSQ